jgi:glycosyltransferase involved in cell wall biosynthesis
VPLRIAILGTRGIPANYGGFETFAEELSKRLVLRGHRVIVYCRERHSSQSYLGVELRHLPTIRHKYFDTLAHTGLSTLHLLFHRSDVALYCNAANAIFTWMPRALGIPVALNVDGLERKRKKWNRLARAWYVLSERLATWFPNRAVSDARQIADYYLQTYGAETTFISYGAPVGKVSSTITVERLGLTPGGYFLYVTRFEPENNPLLVRESFEQLDTNVKLALIGDAPYAHDYIRSVRATTNPRVILPGSIYGDGYHELQSHCLAYVHATEVGGTHPALIEAMGRGCLVLYLNTPENAEVAGGVGIPFEAEELPSAMQRVLTMSAEERRSWGDKAMQRVAERYSWDAVTSSYEQLFLEIGK